MKSNAITGPGQGGSRFPRGARPSPRHKLAAAKPFTPFRAPIGQMARVPATLSMWGNSTYGDCVSAEEAWNKACDNPEDFISDSVVVDWARRHGFLNGADLSDVLDAMIDDGFVVGSTQYNDGGKLSIDYTNETTFQAAIDQGPVKIAIDADALPSGAGSESGWWTLDAGNYPNTDHCVGVGSYGTAAFLFQAMGLPLPAGLPGDTPGYLVFTWSTLGFVTWGWLQGTCVEAWLRVPNSVIVGPPAPPIPDPPNPEPHPRPPAPAGFTGTMVYANGCLMATSSQGKISGVLTAPLPDGAIPWAQLLADLVMLINFLIPLLPQPTPAPTPTRRAG